jgi:hypothetical protein
MTMRINENLIKVEDNLSSINTKIPLSANQGKVLNDKINNVTSFSNNFIYFTNSVQLQGNAPYFIVCQVFTTVTTGYAGTCLGGYDMYTISSSGVGTSRNGNTYNFTSGYGTVYGLAIRI